MSASGAPIAGQGFDAILNDLGVLKTHKDLSNLVDAYLNGDYRTILGSTPSQLLFKQLLRRLPAKDDENLSKIKWDYGDSDETNSTHALLTGMAAFNAFLQANVTGPPLSAQSLLFSQASELTEVAITRKRFLKSLDVDGLSVYQHIPHVELFCLARAVFTEYFPRLIDNNVYDSKWMRIRVNTYHQRLLSSGTSNTRLSDAAASLWAQGEEDLAVVEAEIVDPESSHSAEARVQFWLEKAQISVMQGLDLRAKENLQTAKTISHFNYILSGALGKRTRFQQKDTSQLVVLAKSSVNVNSTIDSTATTVSNELSSIPPHGKTTGRGGGNGPMALDLNDDTLLDSIEFSKSANERLGDSALPPELALLKPDEQPQLTPLDQIILLTEATIKDTFSPLDKLNSEEILPYAVRVLNDKPTNWQIYTQALLVRSRIESHRSRTQERSVLQLQVIVDQIIAETEGDATTAEKSGIPQIQITQFLPRAKPSESAPVTERLKYLYQLNTPTRWEIETELAYAWSSAGSLVSALEIFKRLQLWAEVALCYHSVGQEDKARQIVRRQLYFSATGAEMDHFTVDAEEIITEKWDGEMRSPPPPHAPRLWCILGDLDQDPECWQRAWDISKSRYARAQRALGEYYTKKGDLAGAREAYMKATIVNRQSGDTWSRLGEIDLRVGNWDGAIIAFQQSIMIDDSDAKTYSNLGSALISKHSELMQLRKADRGALSSASLDADTAEVQGDTDDREEEELFPNTTTDAPQPEDILRQALIAYKRGAAIAHSNWQIWDNVITIARRMTPPSFPDILLATRSIIRIRGPTIGEGAIDMDVLRGLVSEVLSSSSSEHSDSRRRRNGQKRRIYVPPRGSLARALIDMLDAEVVPLVTTRAPVYALVEKLRLYCGDYAGALASAERCWRVATAGTGWLEDGDGEEGGWRAVVAATDALASAYENYGPMEVAVTGDGDGDGEGASGNEEEEGGGGHGSRGGEEEVVLVEKAWKAKARSALRGVLGRAKGVWDGTAEYEMLRARLEELKS